MDEAAFERAQIRARIVSAWLAGEPTSRIAAQVGVRPRTVTRIVAATPGLVEERAQRDVERVKALQERVLGWSREHPGDPIEDAASVLGMAPDRVRVALGRRAALHPSRRTGGNRWTDEQIVQHLREWTDRDGTTSGVVYRAVAAAGGLPSLATVTARFGSWSRALQAAGVAIESRGGRPKVWTDDQLEAVVARYFAEADKWSSAGLERWLNARTGGPSISLVRKRLGPWPDLTRLASRAGVSAC